MTLKKINQKGQKGQAIFEYFILTTAVVAVVLFLAIVTNGEQKTRFQQIKDSCQEKFNQAIGQIEGVEEGNTIP